jgi:hypothetical protein
LKWKTGESGKKNALKAMGSKTLLTATKVLKGGGEYQQEACSSTALGNEKRFVAMSTSILPVRSL